MYVLSDTTTNINQDAEEKVELSIMEVSLQYLSEYRDFVNSGAQTFSSISTQIDELKAIWDSKSITLKERDTEKFIISQSKGKLFGLSIDEILEKEGMTDYYVKTYLVRRWSAPISWESFRFSAKN